MLCVVELDTVMEFKICSIISLVYVGRLEDHML